MADISVDQPVAIITQAGDYVGPALARLLARSGHRLVLHGAKPDLVDELTGGGIDIETVAGEVDLTVAEGNELVVQAALDRWGRVDAACFVTGTIVVGPFLDIPPKLWDRVKRANLDMPFHALRAVLPPMLAAGRGQVVVFTSATGANPQPMVSAYSSTRAGANALIRAVGLEHASSGVTINAIGTNYMDFPGFLQATGADDPARRAKIEEQVPMKRLGTMNELAEFAAVLLDGRSRFQTGQFFSFSGSWSP
jgi:NAD(P)-dependent dehydrogenase (short-subunit alcohol dehydrogenase family)